MTTTNWPETVPVLRGKDICRNRLHGENGTHCVLGWAELVSGNLEVEQIIINSLKAETRRTAGHSMASDFNNSEPLPKVAALWNRVIPTLGYRRIGKVFKRIAARKGKV